MTKPPSYRLKDFKFVETNRLEVVEETFNSLFEPRHFSVVNPQQTPDIRVSLARLPYSNIFVGNFGCEMNAVFKDKVKDYHLFVPVQGELTYTGEQALSIKPGEALLLSPGCDLDITWQNDCTGISVVTLRDTFQQFIANTGGKTLIDTVRLPRHIDLTKGVGLSLSNVLHTIMVELEDESSLLSKGVTTKTHNELLLTALLNTNISGVIRPERTPPQPPMIADAQKFIRENLEHPIQLSDIAEACGVSARTLQTGFKTHLGLSPMEFVTREKLKLVREKLEAANPVKERVGDIAAKCGFYHASNFSRNYKRLFGESPSETLEREQDQHGVG